MAPHSRSLIPFTAVPEPREPGLRPREANARSDGSDRVKGRTIIFHMEPAMAESNIVLQFPSGRLLVDASPSGARKQTVAGLVRSLAAMRRLPTSASEEPLAIKLSALTGLADRTVNWLTALAQSGVITPASAGRLALRHSDEVAASCPGLHRVAKSAARYALAVAGDPFGRFAFRLHGKNAWIVFAPVDSLGFLSELCPGERIQACMLVGCDAERWTTVRLLNSGDWRRCLGTLGAGTSRCGCHHVLLLGGLPSREPERSDTLTGIEHALGRGGNTRLVSSSLRKRAGAAGSVPGQDQSRDVLAMIELAFPGLVDVQVPAGDPER